MRKYVIITPTKSKIEYTLTELMDYFEIKELKENTINALYDELSNSDYKNYEFMEIETPDPLNYIGCKIKKLRMEKNIKQTKLAELMKTTQKAISRWENGTIIPSVESIVKLAQILGTTTDELLSCNREVAIIKYEIMENKMETKNPMKIVNGITIEKEWQEPRVVDSLYSERKALETLRGYKSEVEEVKTFSNQTTYKITEYYVQENHYNEDGEYVNGGDICEFAPFTVNNLPLYRKRAEELLLYIGIITEKMSKVDINLLIDTNEEHDYITINKDRYGEEYVWYMDENNNVVINVVTGEIIDDEDFIDKHFC